MFSSALILDADHGPDGWEVALRYDAESLEEAYAGLTDEELPGVVGPVIARLLIAERERGAQRQLP
jgi:hypothetical protein